MKIISETFQSCFKYGLHGTIDFRMILGVIVLVLVILATIPPLFSNSIMLSIVLSYKDRKNI